MQEQEADLCIQRGQRGYLVVLLILVYDVHAHQEEAFFIVHSLLTKKGFVRFKTSLYLVSQSLVQPTTTTIPHHHPPLLLLLLLPLW